MTQAPANGVSFYVIYKGLAQVTTSPSDGSVGDAQIQNGSTTAGKVQRQFRSNSWCSCWNYFTF